MNDVLYGWVLMAGMVSAIIGLSYVFMYLNI